MASKAMQIFLVSFLLFTASFTVASNRQESVVKDLESKVTPTPAPAPAPGKAYPVPKPKYKPTPPPPAPVKVVPPPPPPIPPPVKAPPAPPPPSPVSPPRNTKECYPLCLVRCKLHSRKNVCLRACVTCCDRCKCVPPGQYGNKEKCGKCYANMTTKGGRPKCP